MTTAIGLIGRHRPASSPATMPAELFCLNVIRSDRTRNQALVN